MVHHNLQQNVTVSFNSVDHDQTATKEPSDQNLHSLHICLHHLEAFSYYKGNIIKMFVHLLAVQKCMTFMGNFLPD